MNGQLLAILVAALVVVSLAAPFLWLGIFSQRGSSGLGSQPQRGARRR